MSAERRGRSRYGNQVSKEEAQNLGALDNLSWQEWEKRVQGLLRCNGWTFWRDRVIPASFANKLKGKDRDIVQRIGRKSDLPDLVAHRTFPDLDSVPDRLLTESGLDYVCNWQGEVACLALIECKTGRATTTAGQDAWLRAGKLNPGCLGLTVYPQHYEQLGKILGGKFPL